MRKVIKTITRDDDTKIQVVCVKTLNKMIKNITPKIIRDEENYSIISAIDYIDNDGNEVIFHYSYPIGSCDISPNALNCVQFRREDSYIEYYFQKMIKFNNKYYYIIDQITGYFVFKNTIFNNVNYKLEF